MATLLTMVDRLWSAASLPKADRLWSMALLPPVGQLWLARYSPPVDYQWPLGLWSLAHHSPQAVWLAACRKG